MKRTLSLAGLLLVPVSALVFAQPGQHPLDSNGDGAIDRAEAAAHPKLAERFDRLDRNHDGRLGADERPHRGMDRRHGKHGGGLARLDADRDGRISRAEFAAARAGHGAKHASGHGLREPVDFAGVDANRDGYLVRAELRAYHERMRPQREAQRQARFDARFDAADLDRDGRLDRVEVSEKMPGLAARFEWLDENRDGSLSREELRPRTVRR